MAQDSSKSSSLKVRCPSCSQKLDVSEIEPFTEVTCPACTRPIRVPRRFAGFLLEERIGESHLAEVYRALDTTLDRDVAVKILRDHGPMNATFSERFQAEAKKMAGLMHPRIVPIYSCGDAEGRAYLVMQYLDRFSLARRMREAGGEGLPLDFCLDTMQKVAAGLEAAWNRGTLHHHITPENILFDAEGFPKIADFGLANSAWQSGTSVQENLRFCAPNAAYVSPEKGLTGVRDLKGDLYSFGAVLYHMLSGTPPFPPDRTAEAFEHRREVPPPAVRRREPVPESVQKLVASLLAADPAQRPAGYGVIQETLEDARKSLKNKRLMSNAPRSAGRKLTGRPTTTPETAAALKQSRKRAMAQTYLQIGVILTLLALICLLVVGGVMRVPWYVRHIEPLTRPLLEAIFGRTESTDSLQVAGNGHARPGSESDDPLDALPPAPVLADFGDTGNGLHLTDAAAGSATPTPDAATGGAAVPAQTPDAATPTAVPPPTGAAGAAATVVATAAPREALADAVAAKRPQPADLDFVAVVADLRAYLKQVPKEWVDTEKEQIYAITDMRGYLVRMLRIPYEDASSRGIELGNGRVVRGIVSFANDRELRVRTSGGQSYTVRWNQLSFNQYRAFFEYYAQLRRQRGGPAGGAPGTESVRKDVAADYYRLALLCDWYGQRKEARAFAVQAVKQDPSLQERVNRLLPPLPAGG